jgi:hypothetical protein
MEIGQNTEILASDPLASASDNNLPPAAQAKKRRGRPPGSRKKIVAEGEKHLSRVRNTTHHTASNGHVVSASSALEIDDEHLAYTLADEKLSPFSILLRDILRHDRSEIARVARALEVAENTIYRWMNGSSDPRPLHLRNLPDVLPEHRNSLFYAIRQTFPDALDTPFVAIQEVSKDIYCQVLEHVYTIEEPETRFWHVTQTLFEYALSHLDGDKQGLAITYAALMPPGPTGIHSLRESMMRGNEPWPPSFESKVFLGSNTLAGAAASTQRIQFWDSAEESSRLLVEVDEHEESACATPVMRGGSIAGVLIVSSAQSGFFRDLMASKAVEEFARLLATALQDDKFYSYQYLNLRPMPALPRQRAYIAENYVGRVLTYVRKFAISRSEAELRVCQELEAEFEGQWHESLNKLNPKK